jgi:hypothetical protein
MTWRANGVVAGALEKAETRELSAFCETCQFAAGLLVPGRSCHHSRTVPSQRGGGDKLGVRTSRRVDDLGISSLLAGAILHGLCPNGRLAAGEKMRQDRDNG